MKAINEEGEITIFYLFVADRGRNGVLDGNVIDLTTEEDTPNGADTRPIPLKTHVTRTNWASHWHGNVIDLTIGEEDTSGGAETHRPNKELLQKVAKEVLRGRSKQIVDNKAELRSERSTHTQLSGT